MLVYLFSGVISQMLVCPGGHVQPVDELVDLPQFILYHIQAENFIEVFIILHLQLW